MSITLDLPAEMEDEISAEAAQLGLSLSEHVLRLLSTARTVEKRLKTGAELVEYWQTEQLIGTRPDIADSQFHARRLREQAERREAA